MKYIPYGHQTISDDDIRAVTEVLRSDWLTQGPAISKFEKRVADYCRSQYAAAVCNATAALHVSAVALGLGSGKRVWTSPITFVSSANVGRFCGASVDFVDIDPVTLNMSVDKLESKLKVAREKQELPDVVIPVHFSGQSCNMKEISELSKKYGFSIIEDASHAIGGKYLGEPVGTCRFSDVTVFSFHPVKIITTGEGGLVLTNRKDIFQKVDRLRTHGITRDEGEFESVSDGPWYYEQIDLGFNYRLTDIQAALGSSQMDRLDAWVERRNVLARRYHENLEGLPLKLPFVDRGALSSWHLYVIQLVDASRRQRIFQHLREKGIGVNDHYIPVHLQPYYKRLGFRAGMFPEAEKYYAGAITLPLYSGLLDEDQDRVVRELRSCF